MSAIIQHRLFKDDQSEQEPTTTTNLVFGTAVKGMTDLWEPYCRVLKSVVTHNQSNVAAKICSTPDATSKGLPHMMIIILTSSILILSLSMHALGLESFSVCVTALATTYLVYWYIQMSL